MNDEVKDTHMEYGRPILDVEIGRAYGPNVVLWQLTDLGAKRVSDQTLPSNLPLKAYMVLARMEKLGGYAEEDELSNNLDLSPTALSLILKRLAGFGYIQQAQQVKEE